MDLNFLVNATPFTYAQEKTLTKRKEALHAKVNFARGRLLHCISLLIFYFLSFVMEIG
jgi:hypothetical protein